MTHKSDNSEGDHDDELFVNRRNKKLGREPRTSRIQRLQGDSSWRMTVINGSFGRLVPRILTNQLLETHFQTLRNLVCS